MLVSKRHWDGQWRYYNKEVWSSGFLGLFFYREIGGQKEKKCAQIKKLVTNYHKWYKEMKEEMRKALQQEDSGAR